MVEKASQIPPFLLSPFLQNYVQKLPKNRLPNIASLQGIYRPQRLGFDPRTDLCHLDFYDGKISFEF